MNLWVTPPWHGKPRVCALPLFTHDTFTLSSLHCLRWTAELYEGPWDNWFQTPQTLTVLISGHIYSPGCSPNVGLTSTMDRIKEGFRRQWPIILAISGCILCFIIGIVIGVMSRRVNASEENAKLTDDELSEKLMEGLRPQNILDVLRYVREIPRILFH